MSVIDGRPPISAEIAPGDCAIYVAAQNLGVDQLSLGEDHKLTDVELSDQRVRAKRGPMMGSASNAESQDLRRAIAHLGSGPSHHPGMTAFAE
jgi:3'-phosphoadenosine 5'-phosphosulfate (PAPS) 3'-phosphatase